MRMLGDGYVLSGDKSETIAAYKKALVRPNNPLVIERLKGLGVEYPD